MDSGEWIVDSGSWGISPPGPLPVCGMVLDGRNGCMNQRVISLAVAPLYYAGYIIEHLFELVNINK